MPESIREGLLSRPNCIVLPNSACDRAALIARRARKNLVNENVLRVPISANILAETLRERFLEARILLP